MSNRDGIALLVVMVMVVAVSAIGSGLLAVSRANGVEASKHLSALQAFWAAEAGLSECRAVAMNKRLPFENIPLFGIGVLGAQMDKASYSVDVVGDPDWVNAGNTKKKYLVSSTAVSLGGVSRRVSSRVTIAPFVGFFGGQGASIEGSTTLFGDIASNSDITVGSSAAVQGDATPGPGKFVLNNPENVTGSTDSGLALLLDPLDPDDVADAQTVNNNAALDPAFFDVATGELDLPNTETSVMPAGTYYLSGIDVTGSAVLEASGKVTIYLAGSMDIGGGGIVNLSADPDNLKIYVIGSEEVRIHGGANFYGHIYAPSGSLIEFGGSSDFQGTVATGGAIAFNGSGSVFMDIAADAPWIPLFSSWETGGPSP